MRRIKVLHVTQAIGGVETFLCEVIKHIDADKFEIVIASSEPSIKNLCEKYSVKHYTVKMKRGFHPVSDTFSIFALYKIFKKENPAVIHLHSAKAGFAGRIAAATLKRKSIFTPHGGAYLSFTGFKRSLYFTLEVFCKKFTHKFLAISHTEAYRFIHEVGIPAKDVYIVPNALTIPESFETNNNQPKFFEGKFKIGTIGRLTQQKNPLLFVDIANEVIKKNPDVHFYFLGSGFHDHLKHKVDKQVSACNLENKVHFLDKRDNEFAINFLKQMDVFILPSLYEGLPYALLEAMLYSVPCVVSKCDGNNDVIHNNINGFSCITCEEFTDTILYLINNPEKAKAIGEAGKNYVIEKHNIKKTILHLQRVYDNVATSR